MARITPFRQAIRPGDSGRDVRAVKRAMRKHNVPGAGSLGKSTFAGNAFVHCIRNIQRQAHLPVDGVYGKATHSKVAPYFDAYGRMLYRTAKIRSHTPPGTDTTAQKAAQQLLKYHESGKYRADNPGDLPQIKAAAQGHAVWSPSGSYVHIDKRVFEVLNWLISKGHTIGTYAICTDHHYDGPHGHSGGVAVDISSIDGHSLAAFNSEAKASALTVAKLLHGGTQASLKPRQLICDGYGGVHNSEISACCIPNAAFFGYPTLSQHRNHIHVGY